MYDFYEHVETIGVGSISTISKVRKKNIGGSARYPPPGNRGWWFGNGGAKSGGGGQVVDLGSGVLLEGDNKGANMTGTGATGFFTAAGSTFFELLGRSGARHNRTKRESAVTDSEHGALDIAGTMTGPNDKADNADGPGSSIRLGRLGSGASGTSSSVPDCARVRNDGKDMVFALKAIDLRVVNDDYLRELRNEIEVLKTLDHPNIVRAYESFQKKKNIFLIMEICTGGDLHARHPYTEREAAMIIGKVLSAISYMHKHHVLHRDIKYENIMFESPRPDAEVKLIDFGLAKEYLGPKHVITERVGTVYSMSPEVLIGSYGFPSDMWSLGVVAYMLLSSVKPFWSNKKKRVVEKILRSRVKFDGPEWRFISNKAKEFVALLLQKDPKKRPTAEEAQAHAWLRNEYKLANRRPDEEVMDKVGEALVNYADSSEFKKVALNLIAHKSTAEQIFEIRAAFDQFDSDNDGRISIKGFKAALSNYNYSEEELDRMFTSVDINQDKDSIYFTEFLAATLEVQGRIEEHRLAEAFDRLDEDDSGYISRENLKSILGKKCTEAYLDKLMKEADVNNDGQIEYAEFLALFVDQKRCEIQEIYDADKGTNATNHYEEDIDAYDAVNVDRI